MFTDRLKMLRERHNLNITEVANILNIDRSQYGHYENNYVTLPIKHLINLANYYNVSIDYIFEFTNEKQYNNINFNVNKVFVGERLKSLRKENKITQEKIANLLNTDKSVICRYENGTNLISLPFLYDICKKYKVSADYLLGRIDTPKYFK